MAEIGTATVKVLPDVDPAAFRDAAVLVAGVRLYDALYHNPEALSALPASILDAYGDMQDALASVRK